MSSSIWKNKRQRTHSGFILGIGGAFTSLKKWYQGCQGLSQLGLRNQVSNPKCALNMSGDHWGMWVSMRKGLSWINPAVSAVQWTFSQRAMESAGILKVPYYEKHVFSGLYIYKLVLPEPVNSQNESCMVSKALLQAVQILLLLLRNERRPTSSGRWWEISERGAFIPEVKFGVSSGEIAVFHNVVTRS